MHTLFYIIHVLVSSTCISSYKNRFIAIERSSEGVKELAMLIRNLRFSAPVN